MIGSGKRLRFRRRISLPGSDIYPARADAVGPHVGPQAHSQSMGQGEQAALGCRIRLAIGLGLQGAGRGYVDDAAPALAQVRYRVLCQ